ncbi:hypothetical protein [Mycolicibacterium iranicum]|uniref:Uncharacterized protein n=1 Tax=Mycolicibacterium iranicum TaxID=912594 RepID=A0A178LN10_MYCIR|nr:hypothetical protein [Mycolicibacterium iranicum]OAN32551.1 hypothetical protein A4X20_08495 [Mycolicibacterium iranicum]
MTGPAAPPEKPARPTDVDTGFWLWVFSVPLMVGGYVVDLVTAQHHPNGFVLAISLMFVVIVTAIVLTFMFLMRQGYRWARTLLTGGAIAVVVYSVSSLFNIERSNALAVAYAIPVIIGSVLVGGGVYLLHRKDSHDFFTR